MKKAVGALIGGLVFPVVVFAIAAMAWNYPEIIAISAVVAIGAVLGYKMSDR